MAKQSRDLSKSVQRKVPASKNSTIRRSGGWRQKERRGTGALREDDALETGRTRSVHGSYSKGWGAPGGLRRSWVQGESHGHDADALVCQIQR